MIFPRILASLILAIFLGAYGLAGFASVALAAEGDACQTAAPDTCGGGFRCAAESGAASGTCQACEAGSTGCNAAANAGTPPMTETPVTLDRTAHPGWYLGVISSPQQGSSCNKLVGDAYSTQAGCRAAISAMQSYLTDHGFAAGTVVKNCEQVPANGQYSVTAPNLCANDDQALAPTEASANDLPRSFIPLTSIPGIAEAAGSPDLSAFLNAIYKVCIGAAAVLAVLQIIRGGITYMLGDSITEKREAKHHISLAIFGLVLVLAPALVFGVIDPRILDLKVGVETLKPTNDSFNPAGAAPCLNGECQNGNGNTTTGTQTGGGTGGTNGGGDTSPTPPAGGDGTETPTPPPPTTTTGGGSPGTTPQPPAPTPGTSGTAQVAVTQGAYVYVSYVAASYGNVPHCSFVEAHDEFESQSRCATAANGTHSPYHVVSPACARAAASRITVSNIPPPICPSAGVYPQ